MFNILKADNIFLFFSTENSKILNILNTVQNYHHFTGDNNCLCHSLTRRNLIIKNQKCIGCNIISNLTPNDTITPEFKMLAGHYKNHYLLRSYYNKDKYFISDSYESLLMIKKFNYNINFLSSRKQSYDNKLKIFSVSNKLLNQALIYIVLINIMKHKNYPNIPSFKFFYICNQTINLYRLKYEIESIKGLYDNPLYMDQNILEKDVCRKIFFQIIIFFKFFACYDFLHNEPSIEYLSFDSEYNNFIFENKQIISTLKVYINMSPYSSISSYYQDKSVHRFHLKHDTLKPIADLPFEDIDSDINGSDNFMENKLDIDYIDNFCKKRIFFYKIGNRSQDFINLRRFYSVPIALQSFDIICFLLSLMLETPFYDSFINNYKSLVIWKGLWKKEDYTNLMEDIETNQNHKNNNFDLIFSIIKKYYIRFDALEYLYQMFIKT